VSYESLQMEHVSSSETVSGVLSDSISSCFLGRGTDMLTCEWLDSRLFLLWLAMVVVVVVRGRVVLWRKNGCSGKDLECII
jgi:hypothetical protein